MLPYLLRFIKRGNTLKIVEIKKTMELGSRGYKGNAHKKKKATYPENVTFDGIFKDELRKLDENNSKQ